MAAAPPPPVTGVFQVRCASNLINGGDAVVNISNTLTPAFPNEVVIKLIGSTPITSATGTQSCNPATLLNAGIAGLQPGVIAWGTSLHGVPNAATGPAFQMAETPFVDATLTAAELTRDVQECQYIQILGSGQFGICKGCSNVGLGAAAE